MTSKFALVIANTEYQDEGLSKLTAPGQDAEQFARVLQQPDLAGFDKVEILLNESEAKTRRTIAHFFTERKPDDLLLLYFSGHGVRNDQGQLFLAANDTEIKILEATGVPAEFITRSMNNSRSKRQLLILDCCNSGAFDKGAKSSPKMGISEAFEGNGFGRIVLTATDAVQFAWEGDKVIGNTQNSVFTHFLIEGLNGAADRNGDGKITVDELYDYAYEQVVRRTPKQTPSKWSYKQQGEFFLRENLKPREVMPMPLPSETLDLLDSSSTRSRNLGIQDLTELLDGKNLGWARSAEDKLREIANSDDSLSLRKTAGAVLENHGLALEQPAVSRNVIPTPAPTATLHPPTRGRIANPTYVVVGGVALVALLGLVFGVNYLINNIPASPTPKVIVAAQAPVTLPVEFTPTATQPPPTNTSEPPTFTPTPWIGSFIEPDGVLMMYVPAGTFSMGSDSGDEKPIHSVNLNAYYIDKFEVTNKAYKRCVDAGKCTPPKESKSYTRAAYYSNPEFDEFPVIYVDWHKAKTYCEWRDSRLPTEAEWEKAARGTDGRTYPWGEDISCDKLNYNNCKGDTTKVGSYLDGVSPYGLYDMAGNVWEWTSSLYKPYPYTRNDGREDLLSSGSRVLRGGSWNNYGNNARSAYRYYLTPDNLFNFIGFRCARSLP